MLETHYKCPKCGAEVEYLIHPTYPPQLHYRCLNPKCNYHKDVRQELQVEEKIAPE